MKRQPCRRDQHLPGGPASETIRDDAATAMQRFGASSSSQQRLNSASFRRWQSQRFERTLGGSGVEFLGTATRLRFCTSELYFIHSPDNFHCATEVSSMADEIKNVFISHVHEDDA